MTFVAQRGGEGEALSDPFIVSSAAERRLVVSTALSDLPLLRATHVVGSILNEASGPSYSVPRLCQELSQTGHAITLIAIADRDQTLDCGYRMELCRRAFARVPIVQRLQASPTMPRRLRDHAQQSSIFHVHGLWLMPNVYPSTVARRYRVPLILAPRGMLGPEALKFSRYRKYLMWYAVQKAAVEAASCLHATSEQEYLEIRDFGLRRPVAVVPNGVDVPAVQERNHDSGERTLLYLGRIHPKKGLDRLISAWGELENNWPDWKLRIIGPDEGGYLDRLKLQARNLGVCRVSFENPLFGEQKQTAYRSADLFVMPTLNENFAMTVAEALAQGTPVICTKGAPWRGLEDHGCGWWIDHGRDALAGSLKLAMSKTPEELATMGVRGRTWMIRSFSWQSVALEMSSVYHWLCGARSIPPCVRFD
jgi:glycosyltransferase involved in cell wall biosynthesis